MGYLYKIQQICYIMCWNCLFYSHTSSGKLKKYLKNFWVLVSGI